MNSAEDIHLDEIGVKGEVEILTKELGGLLKFSSYFVVL